MDKEDPSHKADDNDKAMMKMKTIRMIMKNYTVNSVQTV
jgi:hypothetical protein